MFFYLCRSFFFFFAIKRKGKNGDERKRKTCKCFLRTHFVRSCFFFLLRKISYARYCHYVTRSQGGKYKTTVHRQRIQSTVAGERVPVYRQQPFNPMPEGYCELLRISFFFWGTFFFFLASQIRKMKKVQIKKGFCIKICILMY